MARADQVGTTSRLSGEAYDNRGSVGHSDLAGDHRPATQGRTLQVNEGRLDDFMALFTLDATVVDGPTYQGHEAIRTWAQRETFRVHMHIEVLREKDKEGTVIEVNATSRGGYSGPGTFSFTIRGDLIGRFVIS